MMARKKQTSDEPIESVQETVAVETNGSAKESRVIEARENLSRYLIKVRAGQMYLPSSARVLTFSEYYPNWRLETHLIHADYEQGVFAFRAEVYNEHGELVRTGHAMERAKRFEDALEKAETAAIARALGHLGLSTLNAMAQDDERVVDSPIEEATLAPVAKVAAAPVTSASGQNPKLVKLAEQFDIKVGRQEPNEVILRKIYYTIKPEENAWDMDVMREWLRNGDAIKKTIRYYREHGRIPTSVFLSFLNRSNEDDAEDEDVEVAENLHDPFA